MERNDLATERFEAEKLDRDPNQGPTEEPWIDFTKPGQWEEGGGIYRHKPCGIFRPPMYLNPEVYPNRNVLRFPKRPHLCAAESRSSQAWSSLPLALAPRCCFW
jgi:hypothetical protein